jgi:mono/diheme cytochrome c family protein
MKKLVFVIPLLLLAVFIAMNTSTPSNRTAVFAQAAAPDQSSPAEPAAAPEPSATPAGPVPETNPIKPTPDSQAHAAATYKIDCAMCHGEGGNGKGDLVADMGLSMKDLRDPATLQGMSDKDIYMLIHNGKGKMPAEGDRAKPDDLWNLVILVRGFAKK